MAAGTSFLNGDSPLHDQLSLFLIQLIIILIISRLLSIPLRYLKQPTVIAEVIGGILLGPTAMSRIPHFRETVFPAESLPRLKLIADFGLMLFLFLVGLEIDPRKLASDFKRSSLISLSGIILPFALGVGVSKLIYDNMATTTTPFTTFLVFCGIAMSITAFPVLARILTERKLIRTRVGQTTLAAAAGDDAIAWCLLVLVVALINNPNNSVLAVYVFLTVVGWGLFLWFAIRPLLMYLVKKGGDDDDENSISSIAVLATFVTICVSGWFTEAVGIDAIFGGFLVGIITPHERGFAIKITEKVEDLVSMLFLPLYFGYAGLNFSIDSVSDGYSWGVALLVFVVACGGKIIGCTLTSRMSGLPWRESLTVGFLMNTKGLVELIVLNLGLQAQVINTKVYTIFVIMALLTTFMTVPIVSWIYPMEMYIKSKKDDQEVVVEVSLDKGETHVTLPEMTHDVSPTTVSRLGRLMDDHVNVMVCLPSMKSVPSMMNISQMMNKNGKLSVVAVRMISLKDRMSHVMKGMEDEETLRNDSVSRVFETFGSLSGMTVTPLLSVGEDGGDIVSAVDENDVGLVITPAETVKGMGHVGCSVAVLVDRGLPASPSILLLFAGGAEDREAACLTLWLCRNNHSSVSIVTLPPISPTVDPLDQSILSILAKIPGVTMTHLDSQSVISSHIQSKSHDLILLSKQLYDGHSTINASSNTTTTSFSNAMASANMTVRSLQSFVSHAMSQTQPPSPTDRQEDSLRSFLDSSCKSSLLIVKKSKKRSSLSA